MSFHSSIPLSTDSLDQTSCCLSKTDNTCDLVMHGQTQSLCDTQNALCIEIMQLMSDCIIDGLCPRRTHKILLLLNQAPNIISAATGLSQLEATLESIREVWHTAHYQQLRS